MRFSPFLAAGIFAKDVYSVPLEGKETNGYEEGYYDSNGNYNEYTPYSETTNPIEVALPPMSLKAGVFVKVPVLSTKLRLEQILIAIFLLHYTGLVLNSL